MEKQFGEVNVGTIEEKPAEPVEIKDASVLQYQLALPIAKRFSKEIGEVCNKKFKGGAHMAVTVAAFIFRSMLINTVRQLYKNDNEGAKTFITNVYDQAKRDALEDWFSG